MKHIIANWKANPATLAQAQTLFQAEIEAAARYPSIQTIICPPFVFLEELSKLLVTSNQLPVTSLGGQDVFWEKSGPFTGEISTDMLKSFGVTHVLVGHSDRRYVLGETDEVINKKIKAALEAGISPVLLVGEKNEGDDRKRVLEEQLSKDLANLLTSQVRNVLIAYEPVWAISTNPDATPDTPENTMEAVELINEILVSSFKLRVSWPILYGGSISEKNVADFLRYPEITGAVIGAASLRKDEFSEILQSVSEL